MSEVQTTAAVSTSSESGAILASTPGVSNIALPTPQLPQVAESTAEPQRKGQKTADKQRLSRNKHEVTFHSGSNLQSWVPMCFLRVNLRFVLKSANAFATCISDALPRQVKSQDFAAILARMFVRNLVHKISCWTATKRNVSVSDRFEFIVMPNMFWYMVNAFKPIEGVKGETPSLYPDYARLQVDVEQWFATMGVSFNDPMEIGSYALTVAHITKSLRKDCFVTDIASDSLLDAGILAQEDVDEPASPEFTRGKLNADSLLPTYRSAVCVSRRRLSRRDEVLACLLNQRSYSRFAYGVDVYMPETEASEDTSIGVLIAYCASDREVTLEHIVHELILPEITSRTV